MDSRSELKPMAARFAAFFALAIILLGFAVAFPSSPRASGQTSPSVTDLGPWTETTDYGASSGTTGSGGINEMLQSCAATSSYVVCVGGFTTTSLSDVFSAPFTSSGVGAWTEQTDYGAQSGSKGTGGIPIAAESCVAYQSDVYCVGGFSTAANNPLSDVFYAPISQKGSVGPWTETTDYGAATGSAGLGGTPVQRVQCVAASGYIYCVGGDASTGILSDVFYAQLSSSGVGQWTETTDYGAASGTSGSGGVPIEDDSCVVDTSYVYCVGGTAFGAAYTSRTYYAQLSPFGVGPWSEQTDYGAVLGYSGKAGIPLYATGCADFPSYDTIFCGGGLTPQGPLASVYFASVSSTGINAWTETYEYGAPTSEPVYHLLLLYYQNGGGNYILGVGGGISAVFYAPIQVQGATSSSSSSSSTSSVSTTTTTTSTTGSTSTTTTTSSTTTSSAGQHSTTTSVGCVQASFVVGTSSDCTAQVTGESPTGSVSWTVSAGATLSSGTCSLSQGECSVLVYGASPGASTLTAAYSGDSLNLASQASESLTINKEQSGTVVSCETGQLLVGGTTQCTATVTGYNPTGSVSWSVGTGGGVSPASCALSTSEDSCSVTFTATSEATVTVSVSYPGDANNIGSSGSSSVRVSAASTSTSSTSSTSTSTSATTSTVPEFNPVALFVAVLASVTTLAAAFRRRTSGPR